VLIGVPGAFTPVCSSKHVPDYVTKAADIKKAGVDKVACVYLYKLPFELTTKICKR
jgi:peroxiredoxin